MANFRPKTSTVLICIALFFLFLLIRFPYRTLRGYIFGKLYKTTQILVVADDMYPSLLGWPGIGLKNVDVTLPVGRSDLNISGESLVMRLGLGGLFPPVPAVSMKIKKLKGGGNLFLKVGRGGGNLFARVDADAVNLAQLKFSSLPEPLEGKLFSDVDVSINGDDLSKSIGDIELKAEDLKTPTFEIPMAQNYSFFIPSMRLGHLNGKVAIKEGVVSFSKLQFGDATADLSGSLTGEIRLGKDFMGSLINLTLRLKLSDSYRANPQSATFVSFLNSYRLSTPGEYGMRCNSTVLKIATQFACAIPEKLSE